MIDPNILLMADPNKPVAGLDITPRVVLSCLVYNCQLCPDPDGEIFLRSEF